MTQNNEDANRRVSGTCKTCANPERDRTSGERLGYCAVVRQSVSDSDSCDHYVSEDDLDDILTKQAALMEEVEEGQFVMENDKLDGEGGIL